MENDWRMDKSTMAESMLHLMQTGLYSDMTFLVGPGEDRLKGHKMIVMARSEVFANMLQDRWVETLKTPEGIFVPVPQATLHTFKHFLTYLYTDKFPKARTLSIADVLKVLQLADYYQVPGLITKCYKALKIYMKKIRRKGGLSNYVSVYQGTKLYQQWDDLMQLNQAAFRHIERFVYEIIRSSQFLLLDEECLTRLLKSNNLFIDEAWLFWAVIRWSEHHFVKSEKEILNTTESREKALTSLIPLIRFPLMETEYFIEKVVPTKLLTHHEIQNILICFINETRPPTEYAGFSAQPRKYPVPVRHSKLKFLSNLDKCLRLYEKDQSYTLSYLKSRFSTSLDFISNPMISPPIFRCDMSIQLKGLEFYVPTLASGISTGSEELAESFFCFRYSISNSSMQKLGEKAAKFNVPNKFGDGIMLLDAPVKIEAGQFYWIDLSLCIEMSSENENAGRDYSFGYSNVTLNEETTIDGSFSGEGDGNEPTFNILHCPNNIATMKLSPLETRIAMTSKSDGSKTQSYGMIKSIVYSSDKKVDN